MRTLEQAIDDCTEIARNKQHAATYYRYKHGKTKDWQELQEAADDMSSLPSGSWS